MDNKLHNHIFLLCKQCGHQYAGMYLATHESQNFGVTPLKNNISKIETFEIYRWHPCRYVDIDIHDKCQS